MASSTNLGEISMWWTSPNRAYLASCLRHYAQICGLRPQTSDTLGTLGVITKALLRLNLKGRADMNNINEKGKCKYGGE